MPSFTFSAAETTGLVAFIRAGFDPAGTAVKVGNIDRGRALFATEQGGLRHLPPRPAAPARAPRPT